MNAHIISSYKKDKCDEEKEYCKSTFYREQPVGERRKKPYENTSRSSKPKRLKVIGKRSRL